jgi:ParB family chromosome partitioning protein
MVAPPAPGESVNAAPQQPDPDVRALEQDLTEKLGARVMIQQATGGRGKLVITYHSLEELDGILRKIR